MSQKITMKSRQLIRKLEEIGVEFTKSRGKGGYQLAKYKGKQPTVPVHGDADIGAIFIRELCKQLGIDPEDIL
jgi:predicted RNA binding protein YcfA (HicA-like mRNA interferase family)